LPPEEKKFWHSHNYSVKSGLWIMPTSISPGIIHERAERAELAGLAKTYGKSFIFWQFDRGDRLPLGPPQLMMSFTEDWQLDQQVLSRRDGRYHLNTEIKRDDRKKYSKDHWKSGEGMDYEFVSEYSVHNHSQAFHLAWQTQMAK
ncbi:10279_t:CDS:2, partial [Paraglomus occultum]